MSERPDATHLLTLLAVADAGSESEAARELGISQSAVSRRLAALQRGSAVPLLHRGSRGATLTAQGRALLPHARTLDAALRAAASHMASPPPTPLRLRLGLSHHLVPRLSGALLREARRLAGLGTALEPELQEGYSAPLLQAVTAGTLDAAVTLGAPPPADDAYTVERLGTERVCLATLPDDPVAREGRIDPAALHGETLLLPSRSSNLNAHVRQEMRDAGLEPGRTLELSGPAAVRSAVLAGQGIGVTVWSYVGPESEAGWLKRVAVEPGEDRVDVWLVTASRLEPSHRRALQRLLRGAATASAG